MKNNFVSSRFLRIPYVVSRKCRIVTRAVRRLRLIVMTLCVGTFVAACGGGDDEAANENVSPPPATANPSPSNPTPPPQEPQPPKPPSEPSPPEPVNRAPTISGSPTAQVLIGSRYAFTPSASDPDGDQLSFSVQNLPSWASFDAQSGQLSGTPSAADVRRYDNIRISVTDGEAMTSLAPFSIDVVSTALGTATLSWSAPTTRTDGSPLHVAAYKVYWGTESRSYPHSTTVPTGVLTYVIDELTPGTWYFAVTALDEHSIESDFSNEASKQIAL